MNNIISTGEVGRIYMEKKLEIINNSLAEYFIGSNYKYYAISEETASTERALRFDEGGSNVHNALATLVKIMTRVKTNNGNIFVFDPQGGSESDEFFGFFIAGEARIISHVAKFDSSSPEKISNIIKESISYPLCGMVCDDRSVMSLFSFMEIYDGESFMFSCPPSFFGGSV